LWLGFFLSFAVKTPLFPFHIWLSEAHSTAPLAGSILLAAVILKLATYGYLRVLLPMFPDATNYFSPLVQTIAVITLVYASLATIRQVDTKKIVAYSSIGHQAVVVLGIFSNTIQGIEGAILLSIAHGFSSPGLFICVGGVLYNRYHTRVIAYYRGMALTMPVFTILFFIFTMSNSGVPLTLNFLGEAMSLLGMWDRSPTISALGATGILFSACYSFWLYNRISYGSHSPYLAVTSDLTRREFILLISLIMPIFIFGLFPNIILDTLHVSATSLLYNITTINPSLDLDIVNIQATGSEFGISSGLFLSSLPGVKPKRLTKEERSQYILSQDLKDILVGLTLGDLFINKQKKCINARLEFTQGVVHFEYLQHLYKLFGAFCNMEPKIPTRSSDKRTGKTYDTVRFFTYSLPCFLEFYNLFYLDGKKIVPSKIGSLLTPSALAYWIADDATFQKSHSLVILCTDSFSLEHVTLLADSLNEKWNLQCYIVKVNKNGSYRIYIPRRSLPILQSLLKDIMPPMMLYKIGLK